MIIHDQCDFLCLTIHVEKESDRQNVSGKKLWRIFEPRELYENYELLRLPWKIRKTLKSQAAASYLTAMNALQVEKTWCTSLCRKISLRSNGNKYPANPGEFSHQLRLWMHHDAPSGWSNLALTMSFGCCFTPEAKFKAVVCEIPCGTNPRLANYCWFFAIA